MRYRTLSIAALIPMGMLIMSGATRAAVPSPESPITTATPIQHIVIIYQENHSFDNVLGRLCASEVRAVPCDGTTTGKIEDGSSIPLQTSPDIVPAASHDTGSQVRAINRGQMNAFDRVGSCAWKSPPPGAIAPYSNCYTQYAASQIPSLAALARRFAISDRTFESSKVPSFGAHLELAAATLDGLTGGGNPIPDPAVPPQPGWGCDSNRQFPWSPDSGVTPYTLQPTCVPFAGLDPTRYPYRGAYRPTSVPWVPTIMDRAQDAGVSLRLYAVGPPSTTPAGSTRTTTAASNAATVGTGAYSWTFCAYFADCLYTSQRSAVLREPTQFIADAQSGDLPAISFLMPGSATVGSPAGTSQHNNKSMMMGDNRIGQVVSAVQNNPALWASTAILIAYDDCGCFYDHVPPPSSDLGVRVPMVLVSPYAKPGFTDHNTATFASILAFAEHTFGLAPLNSTDASAYDYADSFDFTQVALAPAKLTQHAVPASSIRWVATHPDEDADDPT